MLVNERLNLLERVAASFCCRFLTRHQYYQLRAAFIPRSPAMSVYRGIGRGKRCFIMGGGPSLKLIDPVPLRNEVTFGVNGIFLIQDWLGFLPTYYVVEDYWVVEDRGQEISDLAGPTKFYSHLYDDKIATKGNVVFPEILFDYTDYPNFPEFSRDASRCLWVGGTVSYLCLQLAYYMEFDEVYLIGFDHNYVKPDHVETDKVNWTSQGDDPNHFHPDYFGKGKRWHDPRVDRMELAYQRANAEFEKVGRKIYNATEGGRLEVFERVRFNDIFSPSSDPAR